MGRRAVLHDMRAYALDQFGEAGSIHELPEPQPSEGQVRVRVEAASINPFDLFVMKGFLKDRMPHHFPLVPLGDLSGVVDAVGAGVASMKKGDAVFGTTGMRTLGEGSLAEKTIASAATLALRPPTLTAVEAAALPLAGVSAIMLVEAVDPKQGDVVVVVGASGGIGGYAVQLASHLGARVVAVTSAQHVAYVKSLGATDVIDRSQEDVAAALKGRHPDGVAGIIDTISDAATLAIYAESARRGGAVASMRGAAVAEELEKRGLRATNISTQMNSERLTELARLVAEGTLRPGLIHRFTLDEAARAFEMSGQGAGGKIVISL